jgi:hypothetical protein
MPELLGWHSGQCGPSIVMPTEVMSFWEGTEPPSGGRVVEATFRWDGQSIATDYDHACDAEGTFIPVGSTTAYVLTGTQQLCAFESNDANQQLLLELWAWNDEEPEEVLYRRATEYATALPAEQWKTLGEMHCASGQVWAFHAAYPGVEVLENPEEHIETPFSFRLKSGTYQVLYAGWPDTKWKQTNGLVWLKRKTK